MEQQQIIEGNKLIAEFMEATPCKIDVKSIDVVDAYECEEWKLPIDEIEYHKSWDWLMPVVEKIEGGLFAVTIRENACRISGYRKYHDVEIWNKDVSTPKIQATYKTVLQFITWYNINVKKP
jgi:hypothetical protein